MEDVRRVSQGSKDCLPRNSPCPDLKAIPSYLKAIPSIILGAPLQLTVFQLGYYGTRCLARGIINLYNSTNRIFKCFTSYVNQQRLQRASDILKQLGGTTHKVASVDGEAQIEYMLLRTSDMERVISSHGGSRRVIHAVQRSNGVYAECTYQDRTDEHLELDIIEASVKQSAKWLDFERDVISQMGWQKIELSRDHVIRPAYILDERTQDQRKSSLCLLRCHSPGVSYPMEKRYVGRHLPLADVCLFNYRGMAGSPGTPSEGGWKCDAETVYQELIQKQAYKSDQICATGYCGGGWLAIDLKMHHPDEGVSCVAEHPSTSLEDLIRWHVGCINSIVRIGLPRLQSSSPAITGRVNQDYFNALNLLRSNKKKQKGKIILIETDTDVLVPPKSGTRLYAESQKVSRAHLLTNRGRPGFEGHDEKPFNNPVLWKNYKNLLLS